MFNSDSLLKRVRCSIHHGEQPNYLSIDPKTFQVICSLCAKEGLKSKKKNLIIVDPDLSNTEELNDEKNITMPEEEDSNHFCFKHKTEPSLFYCEECSQFICKTCFATEHRGHSSSTFDLISEVIKEKVNKLYEDLESLNKALEESNDALEEKNKYFEDKKQNFKNNLENVNQHITKALEDKATEYNNQIESFFNGVDKEVESNLNKLEIKRKTANKMYEEFKKMQNDIEQIDDDHKICLYKKEKDETIKENRQFLFDIKTFLQDQLTQTKERVEKEETNFKEKCESLKKNMDIYESSVISTMKSGIPNICSRIRRLCKYSLEKSKYFKTDSLCMIVSQSINLTGFAICGLFHEPEQPIQTYKINLKLYEVNDANNFNKDSKEMLSIDVDIPSITNYIDPVYQFYLSKSYLLNKDKFYFIILTNLSQDIYINTWSGSIYKDKNKVNTSQNNVIISNNDNIKFTFLNAFGIESDFNEFSNGIISDIIYSPVG
jgi:hypothetical protein